MPKFWAGAPNPASKLDPTVCPELEPPGWPYWFEGAPNPLLPPKAGPDDFSAPLKPALAPDWPKPAGCPNPEGPRGVFREPGLPPEVPAFAGGR